jgi:LmbE family N-acetylglucosaminyl deacetylase
MKTPRHTNDQPAAGESGASPRRAFLRGSALASLAGAGLLAAQSEPAATPSKKKTFLAIEGHMDDAEIGVGGILIQAARAGHRVVIVTVASDLTTWPATVGREEQTRRDLLALAKDFGFEKRFVDGAYHQTSAADLALKKKLAEIHAELKPDVAFVIHNEDHWPDHAQSGLAAHDALLFSHSLSHSKAVQRCPLIYAYDVTPEETWHFDADVYYDVTDVMPAYMDLIARVEAIRAGWPLSRAIRHEFRAANGTGPTLRLSTHGLLRFADCVRFGNRTGCQYAIGLRTVWGKRRGEPLV